MVNGSELTGKWDVLCLPFHGSEFDGRQLPAVDFSTPVELPALFSATLNLTSDPTDTFISMHEWGKGVIIINGRNLGRYWVSEGPQVTLYIPASWLKQGKNKIFWFEEEKIGKNVEFRNEPDLGERNCGDDTHVRLIQPKNTVAHSTYRYSSSTCNTEVQFRKSPESIFKLNAQ